MQTTVETNRVPSLESKPIQTDLIGFMDNEVSRVFQSKDIKNKDGANVGYSITMKSQKDVGIALGLAGKDNKSAREAKTLEMSDSAMRAVKSQIAGLGVDWTLAKVAQRTLGNGVKQITVVCKEIKRNVGPSDADIAKALGITVEQVAEMRGRQTAALAAPIDMAGEMTDGE